MSAEPDYHEIELDPHYQHLVMCSDGLLEKLTAYDIAQYVQHTSSLGLSLSEISNGLVQQATDSGSKDNISVSVTSLANFV